MAGKCNGIIEQDIKEAADKYGFNLEFKVAESFSKLNYRVSQNELLEDYKREYIEIDVIAQHEHDKNHFLVECKCAAKDTALILVKPDKRRIDEYEGIQASRFLFKYVNIRNQVIFGGDFVLPMYTLSQHSNIGYSFTGDFFQKNNNNTLNKMSKNNDENNFYKAQQQIISAIKPYCEETDLSGNENINEGDKILIVPMIVTNADIWIVNYNGTDPEFKKCEAAIHFAVNDGEIMVDVNFSYLPILVVHREYLDKILEQLKMATSSQKVALLRQDALAK